ncbi:MAG: N-acetyltransferase family protein [Hyphomicrobiaceae bacterium]
MSAIAAGTRVSVREATLADVPAIATIYRPAVLTGTASFEVEPPDDAEMARRFQVVKDGGFPYLVAELAGAVVGYAYFSQYRPRPAYRFSIENSIYVAPEVQGQRVGRVLLAALIQRATEMGYRQMIAVIGDSRNLPSIGLHRAAGFRFTGTIHSVGFKHGRWLDSVMMQLPLGPGDTTLPD